jgi:hypothetical protein
MGKSKSLGDLYIKRQHMEIFSARESEYIILLMLHLCYNNRVVIHKYSREENYKWQRQKKLKSHYGNVGGYGC